MSVVHAVNRRSLEDALQASRAQAREVLSLVNKTQNRLENTQFIGEQAERLEAEMNDKMGTFVHASYENVDEVLRLIVHNMNVVVTKLGGQIWTNVPIDREAVSQASVKGRSGGDNYEINPEQMNDFAAEVDTSFEEIAASYRRMRSVIADGTPDWQGPEKVRTVAAIDQALTQILGTPQGGQQGVYAVGESLSKWLRDQAAVMVEG